MPLFESYDRRIKQINEALAKYGIGSIEEAEQLCLSKGINPREIVNGIQPIAFENAGWAYVVGAAIAIKKGCTKAADAAEAIGEGLQSFAFPALLRMNARWAWATATWPPCSCAMKRNASASWPGTNPLPPLKVPSVLPSPPTASASRISASA